MGDKKKPEHIRLPQRAEAVEGLETLPAGIPKPPQKPDPRTVSQDPTVKPKVDCIPLDVSQSDACLTGTSLNAKNREPDMPAKSAAQQKAAGAALSAKRGETPKSKLKGASKSMVESMSEAELKKMASTKRKGKPEHTAERK